MATKTIKIRIKDSVAKKDLNKMARSINFVWNYCNEISFEAIRNRGEWLNYNALQTLTKGANKELGLNSASVQMVCREFVTRRRQFKKRKLRFRGKKSLGWIPFRHDCIKFKDGMILFNKRNYRVRYADQMADEVNEPIGRIYEACEQVLLSSGLYEEAYQKYGLMWTERNSNLATFRAIAKKYPQIDKKRILRDLIAEVPGDEGKWFATAKDLGEFDLAIELVPKSPCDPKTLNRAASKYLESNPEFAMNSALASLRWLCEGYGYEITNFDVIDAYKLCMDASKLIGQEEQLKSHIERLMLEDTTLFVRNSLSLYLR